MKQLFRFWIVATLLLIVGCSKEYDDSALVGRVDDLENRVQRLEQLCQQMNTNISSLQTIVTALQNNDYVTGVTPITENGKTIGYTITFAKAQSITIYHGKDSNHIPIIGVKQDTDGIYYWTLDGEWLLDDAGNKIKAQGVDGKDGTNGTDGTNGADGKDGEDGKDGTDGINGADGKDGITPQLKIENDYWFVSYDNGTSWTQLGKATGEDGKDGTEGKSFFQDITQDENNVYFTLSDGTVITVPKGLALGIEFAESDLLVMSPNSTREIAYTVTSATDSVKVEVISSADIKAKVVVDDASNLTGKINITTGTVIDEYSRVVVFVSNGDRVIMRSITFEEAGLEVEDNAVKNAAAEGGEMTLEFLSNVRCEVVIPEEAQDWISIAPTTRAMVKQSITLMLEPNTGYYRSATVTVQSPDGTLKLEYKIEQKGDLGDEIDPTKIPDNEIWYTTTTSRIITPNEGGDFGAKLVSNEYKEGLGVMTFDAPVTKIDGKAFENFLFNNCLSLKSIYLPPTVTIIGEGVFYRCENLKYIYIPESVKEIGPQAFMYTALSEINIPYSVEVFGFDIMSNCSNLREINSKYSTEDKRCLIIDGTLNSFASYGLTEYDLPNTIEKIGYGVFCGMKQVERIGLPETLKIIEKMAFDGAGLKNAIIPEGVTEIHDWAFRGNEYLESIHFPSTVEFLGQTIIGKCPNLRSITGKFSSADKKSLIIDGELISIALYELRNYTIPPGVHTIGEDLFWANEIIENVIIPEGVKVIRSGAFYGCDRLRSIEIPSTVDSIGYRILGHCTSLERISGGLSTDDGRCLIKDGVLEAFAPAGLTSYTVPDNVKEISASVFGSVELQSIILPEGLEIIDEDAFRICWNLTSITIPSTVKSIGNHSGGLGVLFYGCNNLAKIFCNALTPPDLLVPLSTSAPIYVPEISLEAYRQHPEWSKYKLYGYTPDIEIYESTDYSQDGITTVLQTATIGNGIDIVLMGDAYSDRQIEDETYRRDMEYLYDNLFTEEPYKSFREYFNVYYVNVVSPNEGYGAYNKTALDGFFGAGTLAGGNDDKAFAYALRAIDIKRMDEALIIVSMNSDNYAGTCYMYYPATSDDYGSGPSVSYFPHGGDEETFVQFLHHEACGHGFAKLADEYANEYNGTIPEGEVLDYMNKQKNWGWWKNVDFTSDLSQVRWKHFLNDSRYQYDGLGAYEGGLTYWTGVWRPTENSIMRYNTGGFNAPSREAIYYRIHKLAYGDSWEYDYEEFVEWDARNRTPEAMAARAKSHKPSNYKPTHPPVIVNKSWRKAN